MNRKQKPPINQNPQQTRSQPQQQQVVATQIFQSALPPPEVLKGFDAIVPGTALRLINLAEQESIHRRLIEQQSLDANITAQNKQLLIKAFVLNKSSKAS